MEEPLDVAALIARYRHFSHQEIRARQATGQRAADRVYALGERRAAIDNQLHAAGLHHLRNALNSEHVNANALVACVTGQPDPYSMSMPLDSVCREYQHHHAVVERHLAEYDAVHARVMTEEHRRG